MSNTHHDQPFLHSVTSAFLLWGILVICTSGASLVSASATGQGSSVIGARQGTDAVMLVQSNGAFLPVVQEAVAMAELRLVIGMLLVLAGMGFHMLMVTRRRQAEPVRKRPAKFTSVMHRAFRARIV